MGRDCCVGIIREQEMCFYEAFFRVVFKGTVQRDLPRAFSSFS
jgi:hypothetical protein